MIIRKTLSVLREIVRPVYENENTINLQVGPGERTTVMIEHMIESPAAIETGDEEIAIVDNEDRIVKDDIALMEDVETAASRADVNPLPVTVVPS